MISKRIVSIAVFISVGILSTGLGAESLPKVEKMDGAYPMSIQGDVMDKVPAVDPNQSSEFEIRKGEKLRKAMRRWAQTVGYELVWQPEPEDGDIRFASSMVFTGTFAEAANDFFMVVREQTKFDGRLHSNRVLRVYVANAKM